jgi:para-nitrobenzyl esterase
MTPYFGAAETDPDYLTVDVYAPTGGAGCPVMVFVHGGGFVSGATQSPLCDGTAFAGDGVVLVNVTYRLGIVGFLDLPDAPPNRGLLDVLAALDWVRANIATFGGDPDNVTLFGQSAGATLVGAILARPDTARVVRRAIMQSGNGLGAFSSEQAARVTHRAAELLGVSPTAADFAGVPVEELVGVVPKLAGLDLRTATRFDPLLGLSALGVVLDEQPAESVENGAAADIPLLLGTNAQEGNLYLVPGGEFAQSTEQDALNVAAKAHADPVAVVQEHRVGRPDADWGAVRSAILGDALFGIGTRRLADARASRGSAPTHRYEFVWRSDALDGLLGAAHAVELPFVFDRLEVPALRGPRGLLGDDPPTRLAEEMHGAWVDYARTGDPGWEPSRDVHRFA